MGTLKKNKWVIIKNGVLQETKTDTYEADPFIFKDYLFFELYDYNKGVIACRKDDKTEIVLERPYHLSFPCVFEDKGEVYMLPETVNNRQLELYKAKNFPYNWELIKVIKQGWFDDPIIHKTNEGYSIFTTEGENNLRVLHSTELLGEWQQVYSDSSKQYRSAGNIFRRNGKSIRPVQDCEKGYGKGLIFYELNGFEHKELSRFYLPEPFTGCHTYNDGIIDGRLPYDTKMDTFEHNTNLRQLAYFAG